jgi:zinc transport system substrate-binding protein
MILMPASRRTVLASTAAAALLLSACSGGGSAGDDGRLSVVASFYPLEWVAAQVGGDRVALSSLTPPGAEAHDVELTPQDVGAVSEADLVAFLHGFQPAVDEAVESEAGDRAWDAGEAADLSLTAEGHDHAEDDGVAGEDQAEEDHEGEETTDPHFWLDPVRMAAVADALADRLAELDPDGAATYEQNAVALRADLEALDAEMQEALSSCSIDTMVTAHDAFGYLAQRYGFEVVGISGLSPSQEPDPAQVAEIADLVDERGVTTVYTETLVDPAVAETVAGEAGAQTAVLDPLEGLTDESAGEDYLSVMRANLATLQQGQGCS